MSRTQNATRKGICPKCGAQDGEPCVGMFNQGMYTKFPMHEERVTKVDGGKLFGREKRAVCTPATKACKRGSHKGCSGFCQSKHGIAPQCMCYCHKVKAKEIPPLFETYTQVSVSDLVPDLSNKAG